MGKSLFERDEGQGIPIGNLTSQFGANVYLNSLDHFVSRNLRPGSYQRYMDDLLLMDTSREKLLSCIAPIEEWVSANRKQSLNPSKTVLGSFRDVSMNYLGYRVSEKQGELVLFPQAEKKWKLIQKVRSLENEHHGIPVKIHPLYPGKELIYGFEKSLARVRSGLGYFHHSKSFFFKKVLIEKAEMGLQFRADFFGLKKFKI